MQAISVEHVEVEYHVEQCHHKGGPQVEEDQSAAAAQEVHGNERQVEQMHVEQRCRGVPFPEQLLGVGVRLVARQAVRDDGHQYQPPASQATANIIFIALHGFKAQ